MTKTTVVNVRHDEYDVYIGRANSSYRLPASVYANPYKIGKGTSRENVIRKYEDYLRDNPHLVAGARLLKGKRLGCWCAPKLCHGDVLAALADMEPERFTEWREGRFDIVDELVEGGDG